MNPLLAAVQRLAASRKVQTAAAGVVAVVLARLLGKLGLTPEDINYISGTIIAGVVSVVLGIAHEDASSKGAPTQQNNVNSDVVNATAPAAPTPEKLAADMTAAHKETP